RDEAAGDTGDGAKPRGEMPYLSVGRRLRSFAEVNLGFDEATAAYEARRCLRCDLEKRRD
ncbi:MAG TPA: hypothetical protein VLX12_01805, partial [Syntrophorhabdales bacterium]|nr:hypothetical protein [Syntrophorhabdales bacterium]